MDILKHAENRTRSQDLVEVCNYFVNNVGRHGRNRHAGYDGLDGCVSRACVRLAGPCDATVREAQVWKSFTEQFNELRFKFYTQIAGFIGQDVLDPIRQRSGPRSQFYDRFIGSDFQALRHDAGEYPGTGRQCADTLRISYHDAKKKCEWVLLTSHIGVAPGLCIYIE